MAASADARRPRVALVALGCRVNRADLDAIAAELAGSFDVAGRGERADLVVVNTCSITADAASAARQAIRRAARDHPGAPIVAAGCHAELSPDDLATLPGVAAVMGTRSQTRIGEVLERLRRCGRCQDAALDTPGAGLAAGAGWGRVPDAPARHTRPFLKVQDGCDARCSYCVVPLARGASRSLPLEEAVHRIARLGARHPEIVLTGVHLGAYGRDLSPRRSLADLLAETVRRRAVHRLRLSSLEPDELPRETLDRPEVAAALCAHLHLPVQSGSARLLAAMRRPYRPDDFRAAVEDARRLLPGACIGTDVIAGFPGETEEDHALTLALLESLPLAYVHVFPFSPRPGTPAASAAGRVPPTAVRARAGALLALSDRKWRSFLAAQVERVLEVVVEGVAAGVARGTAREWVPVRWPASGEQRGTLASVRVTSTDGERCLGVIEPR